MERPDIIRFEGVEVSFKNKEVLRGENRSQVPDQLLDLLWVLVQHAPDTVSHAEIALALWSTPDQPAARIHTLVNRLRDLLDDNPDDPRLILTVPRRGYRFVGTVAFTNTIRARPRWVLPVFWAALAVVALATLMLAYHSHSIASKITVRVFNCDDECLFAVNGKAVFRVGFGQDSGWRDVTELLVNGSNDLKTTVMNNGGAITYGVEIRRGSRPLTRQICGEVHVMGCNDNQAVPAGVVREISYRLWRETRLIPPSLIGHHSLLPISASTRRRSSEPGVSRTPARSKIVRRDGLFLPRSSWPM